MDWVSMMLRKSVPSYDPSAMGRLPDYGYGPMTDATRAGNMNPEMRAWTPTAGEDAAFRVRQRYGQQGERAAPVVQALTDLGGETLPPPAGLPSIPSPLGVVGAIGAGIAEQPLATGKAIGDAIDNPSTGTVTNAAVQSAMMAGRPVPAIGALATGYGAAGAQDVVGMIWPGEAQAKTKEKKAAPAAIPDLPGLSAEDNAAYKGLMARLGAGDFGSGAERRAIEAQVATYTKRSEASGLAQVELDKKKKEADQAEYERGVTRAEGMAAKARGRDDRFSDSAVKKVYDATGGPAGLAALAAGGTGIIHRSAPWWQKWAEGAGAAFTVNNGPIAYDALMAPPVNPEYEAVSALARELPDTHPDKEKYATLEKRMRESGQTVNPVNEQAWKNLTDPTLMAKRMLMSGIEGSTALIGGAIPKGVPAAAQDLAEGVGGVIPSVKTGWDKAVARGANVKTEAASARARLAQADQAAAEHQLAAAETQKALAEAQRRSGVRTADQAGSQPLSEVSPPQTAASTNQRALPPPDPQTNNPPTRISPPQGEQNVLPPITINVPPIPPGLTRADVEAMLSGSEGRMTDAWTRAIADLKPTAAPTSPNPAQLAPGTVYGPAQSDAVRAALESHMAQPGATIRRGARQDRGGFTSGMGVQAMRDAGVPVIDERQMSTRLGALVKQVGPQPTRDALQRQWASDPGRTVVSIAAPAAAVGVSADPVLRALFGLAAPPAPEPTGWEAAMQRILAQNGVY